MGRGDRGYPLAGYGAMIEDRGRMQPYVAALRQVIRPGAVVLDIGAGTGIFAMIACQLGAGKVIAVEPNPSIHLARELIAANGWTQRVECIEGLSTDLKIANRADVIVSDLRGVLPFWAQHLPSIIDARKRLLAPNGVLIPQRDRMYAAPVEAAEAYQRIERPWRVNDYGLDLSRVMRYEVNRWTKQLFRENQLLAHPQPWLELDYQTLDRCDGTGTMRWTIERSGIVHGIAVWFDAELIPGTGFSNAPSDQPLIYGQAFMPLAEPTAVEPGDAVAATLSAHYVREKYLWGWRGEIRSPTRGTVIRFDQATLRDVRRFTSLGNG